MQRLPSWKTGQTFLVLALASYVRGHYTLQCHFRGWPVGVVVAQVAKSTRGAVEAVEAAGAGAPCNALSALALSFLAFLAFRPSCVSQVEYWDLGVPGVLALGAEDVVR
jgi:hypothetical protein